MIVKIISGGQTGVDRAALDAAIRLGVPHGGWIPKGRLTEDGPLPETYALKETASAVYAERTEKNVLDADGTLIIARGKLRGGTAYTREMAVKHGRPWLHVDLRQTPAFRAALVIRQWIATHRIMVLNVAGPRASKDPRIYSDTLAMLESVFYLSLADGTPGTSAESGMAPEAAAATPEPPACVRDALQQLSDGLPLKDRVTIANMTEGELPALLPTLGEYIVHRFGLPAGNIPLMRSCRWVARRSIKTEEAAARLIIRELWKQLLRTHALRRIK
jgi:hypothetical protein